MATAELLFRINTQTGDFKSTMAQVRSELTQTSQTQQQAAKGDIKVAQEAKLAQFLHRRELSALVTQFKQTERAAAQLATGVGPVATNLQRITDVMQTLGASSATLTGPLGGVAGRLRSVGALATEAGGGLGVAGVAAGAAVVAIVALVVAGGFVVKEFSELIVSTAEWQGKLHDTSQQTEVSVETLSGLEVALRKAGGELGSATQAIITFQTKLADAQDPMSDTALRFEALGIAATDTEGAFRQALAAVAAMPDGFEKVNTAAELFGRRGAKQLLAAIKETGGDLDKLMRQLKAMGLLLSSDAAKAADDFNDELLTVQLQVRALTAELVTASIPQILAALRETSKIIAENRANIELVGSAIGVFVRGNVYGVLLPALKVVAITLKEIETAWNGVRRAAEVAVMVSAGVSADQALAMVNAREAAANRPSPFDAGETDSGLGGDLTSRREFRESQERLKQAKFEAEEQKRISADKLSQAQRDYQQGRITREKERDVKIAALNAEKTARLNAFQAEEVLKQQEMAARQGDVVAQKKIAGEIDKIRQDARNLQSETNRKVADEEQKALEDRNKSLIEHLDSQLTLRLKANEAEIKLIEARVKNGEILAQAGEDQISQIETQGLEARRQILRQELALVNFGSEEQKRITQKRSELEQEATETQRRQAERRKQITREELEHERSLLLARLDTQLRLGTISDNAQMASLRALAVLRIRTEEQTEKTILAIRLAALDREAEATRAKLTAAGSIADPKARAAEEQKLNDELKIILAERTALVEQGARDVDAGRQRDLEGLRKYRDAYRELLEGVADSERNLAKLRIEMLITSRASRSAILQAEFEEETAHADKRHARQLKRLRDDYDAAIESAKTMQEKLAALQVYNAAVELENERHDAAEKERKEREKQEKLMAGPYGGFLGGLETGQLKELENGIQSFQDMAVVAFSAVGAAVNGLAQGIGGLVQNWVLMGSTGPNAMRKMVASVLAGVAAQSAVLAIFELAKGFAALFFNPAEAAAHFQAAALFGSLAFVTAVAGRAVAGDAFKDTAGGGGSSSSLSRGSEERSKPATIKEEWVQRRPIIIQLQGDASQFDWKVVNAIESDVSKNGSLRGVIVDTAKKGK